MPIGNIGPDSADRQGARVFLYLNPPAVTLACLSDAHLFAARKPKGVALALAFGFSRS